MGGRGCFINTNCSSTFCGVSAYFPLWELQTYSVFSTSCACRAVVLFRDICPGVGRPLLNRAPGTRPPGSRRALAGVAPAGQRARLWKDRPRPPIPRSRLSQVEVGRAEGSCCPTRWGTGIDVRTADVPRWGSGPVTPGEARVQRWTALQAALWVGQTAEKVLGGDL